jgi:uncharacterized membrane protein
LIFVDTTSAVSFLGAIENIFWSISLLLILYGIVRKRRELYSKEALPAIIFFITYLAGASSYQGNLGTAFRHKSLILWALLLCVYRILSTIMDRRKKSDAWNNSQESAV